MRFENQEEVAAYAEGKLSRQIVRAEELVRPLDPAQRARPRADGGWRVDASR